MTLNVHPIVLSRVAEHRCAELRAQVDRERLAGQAASVGIARQTRRDVPVLRLVASLLTLVLTVVRPH